MSIVTPDKACLYLKAGDKTDRQKWVVALAMAKMADHPIETPGTCIIIVATTHCIMYT